MSSGEEVIIGGAVAVPVAIAGTVAGTAATGAAVGAGMAALAAGLAVAGAGAAVGVAAGVAGAVIAAGVGAIGAVGYGIYKAGQTAVEIARIEKENREKVKKATEQYLESLKQDEAKGEEFIKNAITYFDQVGGLFTKDEAEQIINKESALDKRVEKAHELLELASEYEMMLENLHTVMDMASTLHLSTSDIDDEISHIEESKDDLVALRSVIKTINDKIIDWIREEEKKLEQEAGNKVFTRESWKIVTESRDVIACVCQKDIIDLFEKSNNREIAEAKLQIEINNKRMALMVLYNALSDLRGFSLFEKEALSIISDTMVLFQEDHPELTDSGIDKILDQSLARMRSLYNRCVEMLGQELVEAKIKFEDAVSYNKALRIEMNIPAKKYVFNEDDPQASLDEVLKDNEELQKLYENTQKNKVWMAKLNEHFRNSGYIYVVGGREEMRLPNSDVVRTSEYFLTPDQECIVIVMTYSDGRPVEILVEGIKLQGFNTDKAHILEVQRKHCEKSAEILDGLVEGEIKRYEPSEDTAVAVEVENLPDEYRNRALKARKEREAKKGGNIGTGVPKQNKKETNE